MKVVPSTSPAGLAPRISICLPTLNRRRFLSDRIGSIRAQTIHDWELIVIDSYSDDGSYEDLQALAASDSRVKLHQAPRDGIYPNINRCIQAARGDFVYIATSDDTMAPDCLEKLSGALEQHPECDLAHCSLKVIDAAGNDLPAVQDWWSHRSLFARSSGGWRNRPHVRRAPFDGLLQLGGETVYNSLTELLIRRSLFERIGYFETRWGSMGDFHWDMRAGLVADTVHVPDTWGGWRIHADQATATVDSLSPGHAARVDEMIEDALRRCEAQLPPGVADALRNDWGPNAREFRDFLRQHRSQKGWMPRQTFLLQRLLTGSIAARDYVVDRITTRGYVPHLATSAMIRWFKHAGIRHLAETTRHSHA